MQIRNYEPGDEAAQVEIYNAEAASLPAFKLATVEEVTRRYRTTNPDPSTKFYAVEGGKVVGYATFSPHGRISYPWGEAGAHEPLLQAILQAVRDQGAREAWVAYRADWSNVLEFFDARGFQRVREMVNYVANVIDLPHAPPQEDQIIAPLGRDEWHDMLASRSQDRAFLESFFWENPHLDPGALFALRVGRKAVQVGHGLAVFRSGYADPTKIDPAMPCFRLGTFGTERERHKRVNGLVSFLFSGQQAGEALLAEAARRLDAAAVPYAAAQAPSDQPELCAFYDKHFKRQGSFPILARSL